MTQKEIIEMARQAGVIATRIDGLQAFAKLIAEKEREACALICDRKDEAWKRVGLWNPTNEYKECAEAIRARGQT